MSRKAAKPIVFDKTVNIDVNESRIHVKGPKGELNVEMKEGVAVRVDGNKISVERNDDAYKPFQGLIWSLVNNAVIGVTTGFTKTLQVVGKGWRSTVNNDVINLQVGHSHPVEFKLPKGITATQKNPGEFSLSSFDKQLLGQVCANIKALRPVEPYKLKGIRIVGQYLRQKVRKTAGA